MQMQINATLLGQIITFAIFVWFTMKYIWPPIMTAMAQRQKKIADGLEAAKQGRRELALAKRKSTQIIADAKLNASHIIERANESALQIYESAKEKARQESQRLLYNADIEVEHKVNQARQMLRKDVVDITMLAMQKVLGQKVDNDVHEKALRQLISEL